MSYKQFDDDDYNYFSQHFDVFQIKYHDISEDYFHDELSDSSFKPDIVIFAKSTEDISLIMKYAFEKNIPTTVRGSGTGLVGGCVAICGGILIVTTLMNKIIEYDNKNLTISVQCGILLMEINQFLSETTLFYPPDPGEKSATIGGNISTNAGGMRAVKYGVTRDYVRELTLVLPNGEITKVGGKTVKNSSGYSLKDLIIGSEGTLAIVTEAILRLIPKPTHTLSCLVPFENLTLAISAVPSIISSKVVPTAVEFMERNTILFAEEYMGKKFPDTNSLAYILMTFDGNSKEQVTSDFEFVSNLCLYKLHANDAFIVDTDERQEMVWSARGVFLEAIKSSTTEMDECDVVVPKTAIADFLEFTGEVSKRFGVRMPSFGHAGDGNLHIYICRDDLTRVDFKTKLSEIFTLLYDKAEALSGKVSGEHGIGFAKRQYLIKTLGVQHKIMQDIKRVFDEKNILNPNKVI